MRATPQYAHHISVWVTILLGALGLFAPKAHALVPRRADVNIYGEGGIIELPRATLLGDGYYSFGAWANYFYDGDKQAFRASPVSFGLGLPARFDVAFSFSSVARDDPVLRADIIQFRASLKYGVLQEPTWPVGVAVALRVENAFSLPDLTSFALIDRHIGKKLALSAAAGYRLSTDRARQDHLIFGIGAEYRITRHLTAQLEGEGNIAPTAGLVGLTGRASFRWDIVKHLGVALIVASGGFGRPGLRVLLGLRYRPTSTGLADGDGDGIPDDKDACPDEPEDRDGWLDADGCPDPDNDGDGIPDKLDPTPNGEHDKGLHQGPVRLRMRIRQAPIPTWIMHTGHGSATSESAIGDSPTTSPAAPPKETP